MNLPVRITGHTAVSFEPVIILVDHVVKNKPSGKIENNHLGKILEPSGEKIWFKNCDKSILLLENDLIRIPLRILVCISMLRTLYRTNLKIIVCTKVTTKLSIRLILQKFKVYSFKIFIALKKLTEEKVLQGSFED